MQPGSMTSQSMHAKTGSASPHAVVPETTLAPNDPPARAARKMTENLAHPLRWIGRKLARYLAAPRDTGRVTTSRPDLLANTLRKGDVLLVEGTSRFSSAIRYITQSTWSHAALYVGDALGDIGRGQSA